MGTRERIIAYLAETGELFDANGMASTQLAAAVGYPGSSVAFAQRLSASLSLALANARLYETEHRIADRLQEALLSVPEHIEGVDLAHAYHSATEAARVGGSPAEFAAQYPVALEITVERIRGF